MAKKKPKRVPYEPAFEFVSPVSGEHVGESFTARGICEYLETEPDLVITVVFTVGSQSHSVTAVTNPNEYTFEAFFEGVAPGTGELTARVNPGGYEPPAVPDVTVAGLTSPVAIAIDSPFNGEQIPLPNGRVSKRTRAAPPWTTGSHGDSRQVRACITRGGYPSRPTWVVVEPNSGGGGPHPYPFRRGLVDLLRSNGLSGPGKYGLHFLVRRLGSGSREWIVSQGFFHFVARRRAAPGSKSKTKSGMNRSASKRPTAKRPAAKRAKQTTRKRKTVKRRK